MAAEAVGGATEKKFGIDAFATFERLETFQDFGFAAFFERDFDGFFEFVEINRFVDRVMGAARALERHHLLLNFERAADEYNRNMRDEFFQFGQIIEAVFAFVEDVIENDEVWLARGDRGKSVAASGDAFQFEIRKGVFIDLIL